MVNCNYRYFIPRNSWNEITIKNIEVTRKLHFSKCREYIRCFA